MAKASKRIVIKNVLDKLYDKYNHNDLIKPDPLQFVYQYDKPSDREIVALLAADLAYGRVEQIQKSLTNLFECMGESPYEFVRGFAEFSFKSGSFWVDRKGCQGTPATRWRRFWLERGVWEERGARSEWRLEAGGKDLSR